MIKAFAFALFLCFFSGCDFSSTQIEYNRAERAFKEKDFSTARKYYLRVLKRNPDSPIAMKAAEKAAILLAEDMKYYDEAINLYQFLIIKSQDQNQVKNYQLQLARLLFDSVQDYSRAIEEFNKLIKLETDLSKKTQYQIYVAKSYFNLNKFYQAKVEVEDILKMDLTEDDRFQVLLFKGNILLTIKDHKNAIDVYTELIEEFPERSVKENVQINLAVCFEELKDFDKAISILEELRQSFPDTTFIDTKVSRLKARKKNLPGARGRVR
ncbi:MAG: tetratricopeptide repeat protein [Bdellovibrionales bacterium]